MIHRPGQPVPTELGPTLLSYSRQVACGLIYFCVKNFIHRDLAARNVLVSASGMCKVSKCAMFIIMCVLYIIIVQNECNLSMLSITCKSFPPSLIPNPITVSYYTYLL